MKKIAIILLLLDGLMIFLNKILFAGNLYIKGGTTIVGIIILIYLFRIWRYEDR